MRGQTAGKQVCGLWVTEQGMPIHCFLEAMRDLILSNEFQKSKLFFQNPFSPPSLFYRLYSYQNKKTTNCPKHAADKQQ